MCKTAKGHALESCSLHEGKHVLALYLDVAWTGSTKKLSRRLRIKLRQGQTSALSPECTGNSAWKLDVLFFWFSKLIRTYADVLMCKQCKFETRCPQIEICGLRQVAPKWMELDSSWQSTSKFVSGCRIYANAKSMQIFKETIHLRLLEYGRWSRTPELMMPVGRTTRSTVIFCLVQIRQAISFGAVPFWMQDAEGKELVGSWKLLEWRCLLLRQGKAATHQVFNAFRQSAQTNTLVLQHLTCVSEDIPQLPVLFPQPYLLHGGHSDGRHTSVTASQSGRSNSWSINVYHQ